MSTVSPPSELNDETITVSVSVDPETGERQFTIEGDWDKIRAKMVARSSLLSEQFAYSAATSSQLVKVGNEAREYLKRAGEVARRIGDASERQLRQIDRDLDALAPSMKDKRRADGRRPWEWIEALLAIRQRVADRQRFLERLDHRLKFEQARLGKQVRQLSHSARAEGRHSDTHETSEQRHRQALWHARTCGPNAP